VFDHGRIVEQGSYDELIGRGGRFAELAAAQFLTAGASHEIN
jgi:ABC-type multidrug transport system fused ATPase/permease subunit